MVPDRTQAGDVCSILDTTLRHTQRILWNRVCEPKCGFEINLESSQIAVVHTDQVAPCVHGPLQFIFIVHFAQNVEAILAGPRSQPLQLILGQGSHNQQNRVGAVGSRFQQLEFIDNEILAQAR